MFSLLCPFPDGGGHCPSQVLCATLHNTDRKVLSLLIRSSAQGRSLEKNRRWLWVQGELLKLNPIPKGAYGKARKDSMQVEKHGPWGPGGCP